MDVNFSSGMLSVESLWGAIGLSSLCLSWRSSVDSSQEADASCASNRALLEQVRTAGKLTQGAGVSQLGCELVEKHPASWAQ
jgi:hypothetical protein